MEARKSSRRKEVERQEDARPAPVLRGSTLVISNLIKLIGVGIALNEMVIRPDARDSVIAFCALCVLGTQAAEDIFLRVIDRIFSTRDREE